MPPEPDPEEDRPETDPTQAKWITDEFEDEFISILKTAEERIINLVKGTVEKTSKTAPISPTFDKVDEIMGDAYDEAEDLAEEEITKGYQQGRAYASIQLGAPLEERQAAWKLIGDRVVASQSEFKGHTDDTAREIKRIIADGIENEKTQGQIIKDIQEQFEKSERDAIRIIRTESMKAVNQGVTDRYRGAGVEVVEWLAAFDRRTCDECGDLDGRKFEIDAAPPCPKHPDCRCTFTPVVRVKPEDNVEKWKEPVKEPRTPVPTEPKPKPSEPKPAPLKDRVDQFTNQYKGSTVENAAVYDKDGNLLSTVKGERNYVDIPKGVTLKNSTVIHNHPDQARVQLSPADVISTAKTDGERIIAVGTDGSKMTATRPESGWPKLSESKYNSMRNQVMNEMKNDGTFNKYVDDSLRTGKMSTQEAAEDLNTKIVQETWSRLGVPISVE